MSVKNAINWRKAVKIYDNSKPLTNEQIQTIIDAGRMAPSSMGLEPNTIIVIRDKELKSKIANQAMMHSNIEKTINADSLVLIAGYTRAAVNAEKFLEQRAKRPNFTDPEEIANRVNFYRSFVNSHTDESFEAWVGKQGYITLGFMMLQASDLNIGSTPAEGFKPDVVNKILAEHNLINPSEQKVYVFMLLGSYNENTEGAVFERVRLPFDEFAKIV